MRKPRSIRENAIYHVIARVNRGEFILDSAKIKDLFLEVIGQAKGKYRFFVKNFCVMGNHVHLMVQPHAQESLSKIMQWILSVFALRYNRRFKLMGHVWYDRFKSFILGDLCRFLKTFIYIAENPVKAGIASNMEEFPYSAIFHLLRGRHDIVDPPDIICKINFPSIAMRSLPAI